MSQKFTFTMAQKTENNNFTFKTDNGVNKLRVLIVDDTKEHRITHVELIECCINQLQELTTRLSNNMNGHRTENGLEDNLNAALKLIGNTLQYLINCSSFQQGKLESYDYIEIATKLKQIDTFLKRSAEHN